MHGVRLVRDFALRFKRDAVCFVRECRDDLSTLDRVLSCPGAWNSQRTLLLAVTVGSHLQLNRWIARFLLLMFIWHEKRTDIVTL